MTSSGADAPNAAMAAVARLRAREGTTWEAPYRARLTLDDVRVASGSVNGHALLATVRTDAHDYQLVMDAAGRTSCLRDGITQQFRHHRTGRTSVTWLPLETWIDWILADSVLDDEPPGPSWSAEGLDGQLERVEHNIVGYGSTTIDVSQLATIEDLDTALRQALPHSPVPLQVGAWNSDELPTTGWQAFFSARYSGTTLTSFDGQSLVKYNGPGNLARSGPWPTPAQWLVIHAPGAERALLAPGKVTWLTVTWDADGAAIAIHADDAARAAQLESAEELVRRRWGRWFDESVALSDAELEAGLDAMFRLVDRVTP